MLEHLLVGVASALHPLTFAYVVLGVAAGIMVGAMPGLSAATGVALALPLTYGMSAGDAVILLAAMYVGAEYGGSISAILINTPGSPASIATVLDGYALTRKGHPLKALSVSLVNGALGSFVATIALILISVPLVNFALSFGPSAYFAVGMLGLTLTVGLIGRSWTKGVLAALLGLLLAVIGTDPITGYPRFTFGMSQLLGGIQLVPALIGLLALSEAFVLIERIPKSTAISETLSHQYPSLREWLSIAPATVSGILHGLVVGIIPGAGGTVASLLAYNTQKRISRHPEKMGTGVLEGVAAPEAANNAVVGTSMILMLALGVPGSATAAVIMGGFSLHGLVTGPSLFSTNGDVIWSLFGSQLLAPFVLVAVGLIGMRWFVRVIQVPTPILACGIIAISIVGAYASSGAMFSAYVAVGMGLLGYVLRKLRFPLAPVVLSLVLAFLVEANFRRMLLLFGGNVFEIFQRPLAVGILALALVMLFFPLLRNALRRIRGVNSTPT